MTTYTFRYKGYVTETYTKDLDEIIDEFHVWLFSNGPEVLEGTILDNTFKFVTEGLKSSMVKYRAESEEELVLGDNMEGLSLKLLPYKWNYLYGLI